MVKEPKSYLKVEIAAVTLSAISLFLFIPSLHFVNYLKKNGYIYPSGEYGDSSVFLIWGALLSLAVILSIYSKIKIRRYKQKEKPKSISTSALVIACISSIIFAIAVPNFTKFGHIFKNNEGIQNLEELHSIQQKYKSTHGHYGKTFKEIEWDIPGKHRFSYFLSPQEVIQRNHAFPYPVSLPPGFEAFIEDEKFQIVAVGNEHPVGTFEVLYINEKSRLRMKKWKKE